MLGPEPEAVRPWNGRAEHLFWAEPSCGHGQFVEEEPSPLGVHDQLRESGGARSRVEHEHVLRAETPAGRGHAAEVETFQRDVEGCNPGWDVGAGWRQESQG